MSKSLNRVTLIGHVGQDPDIRSTQNGSKVANFTLATTRVWTTNGERQEKAEWHRIVAWNNPKGGGLVDLIERLIHKGDKVYVEGSLEYRQYQDKENVTRYITEINARDVILLGQKTSSPAPEPARTPRGRSHATEMPYDDDVDSDLPF